MKFVDDDDEIDDDECTVKVLMILHISSPALRHAMTLTFNP